MKKILVVLAVMALPQVAGVSTVCNAGPKSYCSSIPDGSCVRNGTPCGTIYKGKGCTTKENPDWVLGAAAKKVKPQELPTEFLCVCE